MAYTPTYVNNNSFLTPTIWNDTQDGIKGIKETTLESFEPTTGETWTQFFIRIYQPFLSGYSYGRVLRTTIQRNASDSVSNIYFHCIRRLSSSTVWCAEYFHAASSGEPDEAYLFFISITNSLTSTSTTVRRITIKSDGSFVGENISNLPASPIAILGLNNNE